MNKEDVVRVAVPKSLFEMATKLGMVKVGEVVVHLHSENMIVREALARGLKLMTIEKAIVDSMSEKDVKKNARGIYTSLVTIPAESASETAGKGREALAQLEDAERV